MLLLLLLLLLLPMLVPLLPTATANVGVLNQLGTLVPDCIWTLVVLWLGLRDLVLLGLLRPKQYLAVTVAVAVAAAVAAKHLQQQQQ